MARSSPWGTWPSRIFTGHARSLEESWRDRRNSGVPSCIRPAPEPCASGPPAQDQQAVVGGHGHLRHRVEAERPGLGQQVLGLRGVRDCQSYYFAIGNLVCEQLPGRWISLPSEFRIRFDLFLYACLCGERKQPEQVENFSLQQKRCTSTNQPQLPPRWRWKLPLRPASPSGRRLAHSPRGGKSA